ncbi:MAG: class I SAM-dependent methyltransferase [Anaerolineales bacterium]
MPPLLAQYVLQKRTLMVLPYIQGDVLDLGCGVSSIPKYLDPDSKYVGVEINTKFIKWSKENYPQYTFYQRDLENGQLILNSQFDTVLMIAVLEHLRNPGNILRQIPVLLKPDGKFVLTTPTPLGGKIHAIGARINLFYKEAADQHEGFYNRTQISTLLCKYCLEITCFERFLYGGNQLVVCKKR